MTTSHTKNIGTDVLRFIVELVLNLILKLNIFIIIYLFWNNKMFVLKAEIKETELLVQKILKSLADVTLLNFQFMFLFLMQYLKRHLSY